MSRTFKDRHDYSVSIVHRHAVRQRRENPDHMVDVLRFSMGRYIKANAQGNVDRSARWFAAVDRVGHIVGQMVASLDRLD